MADSSTSRSREGRTTFTFKCVDCGTRNESDYPQLDSMIQCSKCGFPTVQTCVKVERRNG